ncbi:MAG: hypothetical protein HOH43_28080, partial [Candidatus Latescibacteria bacterium]|nr:hypothetical protein [Candidatus Latescibacterota bacterium]
IKLGPYVAVDAWIPLRDDQIGIYCVAEQSWFTHRRDRDGDIELGPFAVGIGLAAR